MLFTERDEFFYAGDREARQYLTERGKKISDGLTRQEIQEDEVLTTKNIEIIRESQVKAAQELRETINITETNDRGLPLQQRRK
jgi:hypothetical protein